MKPEILVQLIPTLVSLVVLICGFLIAFAKVKATMITKEQFDDYCKANQSNCSVTVGKKIDELKAIVIEFRKEQSKKIEEMDNKRESSRVETSEKIGELNKTIGRMEGHLESINNNGDRRHHPGVC